MTTVKVMGWIVYLAGCFGILLATSIVGIGLIFGNWQQAALAFVWLVLLSANFREYMLNQNRRDGYHKAEITKMKLDGIAWAEQVVMAKSVLASQFAHQVEAVGMTHDRKAIQAAGMLFAAIAQIELPQGCAENIVRLHAQAAEAAEACRTGQMPSERVLH